MTTRWLWHCTLGAALGVALMAAMQAAALRGFLPPAWAILAGGTLAGACLGLGQALMLRRLGICLPCWLLATTLAATLAPALLLLSGLGRAGTGIAPLTVLAAAAIFGALHGLFTGALQWFAARLFLHPLGWSLRNALGWALAMPAAVIGVASAAAAAAGSGWPLAAAALAGAAAGALTGALLGLVTAPALPKPT